MGLSTKQVSNDHGLDWGGLPKPPQIRRLQQQQQQPEPLDCPRCGSTNTKFCYYNNYNKSQPRHFCKACKRHWTKGGTLRNVPFGGARKNKRLKRSNSSTNTNTAAANKSSNNNTQMGIDQIRQQIQTSTCDDQKNISEVLYQQQQQQQQHDSTTMNIINGVFIGSALNQNLSFPFQSLSYNIDTNPCSVSNSFQSSSNGGYNFVGGLKSTMEDTITMPSTSSGMNNIISQPWNNIVTTTTSSLMDIPNYWNWEDIDTMVSTDLNIPWDDSDVKP